MSRIYLNTKCSHCRLNVYKTYYYTSDSLWKIWLVESTQSIHNSLWTWHDKCNICCRYCIADIAFIMSSSTSAWLVSSLKCSPQEQNGWTLRFCFWGWIMWKMCNKTIIEFGFRMISWIIKTLCLCYLPKPSASAENTDLGFNNSWYHAQPHHIIVVWLTRSVKPHYGITWFIYFFLYLSMRVERLSRGLVSAVYVVCV